MTSWEEDSPYVRNPHDEGSLAGENRQTVRQLVIRAVALLLLFSVLGSAFLALRRIKHIAFVIALLGVAALVAIVAKKQRESENPYRSDDPQDIEIH